MGSFNPSDLKRNPLAVMSASGEIGAEAAGRGKPSAFRRSSVASVRPPPAEVPKRPAFSAPYSLMMPW
ncbi:MAG TPA: hypothetical protein VMW72_16895 [Sedimentisphaerales bacterium]|nr:hypothetical protein [Sedimentisphaerales bacterium]